MLSRLVLFLTLTIDVTLACTGSVFRLKGEEIEPGVFNVYSASGSLSNPANPDQWTLNGVSRTADFKAKLDSSITTNSLVFIGTIDSLIGNGFQDTVVSGLVPDFTLTFGSTLFPINYYLRIKVDTLIKGTLPKSSIWIRSPGPTSTCDNVPYGYKGLTFLNFSNGLTALSDLKISRLNPFCANCPIAHRFDGQYLSSPDFPVLKLDIREVLAGFPVALSTGTQKNIRVPLRSSEKAYLPDGRVAPSGDKARRAAPGPLLKSER
jgi:hypothetical protein